MFGLLKKHRLRVTLPKGVRVIAVGDIHGQLDRLSDLMKKVETYRRKNPAIEEHIVFLGDYTDRGPQSSPVVDYLCARKKAAEAKGNLEVFIKGNHEELLLDAFQGEPRREELWWRNGGKQAVQSYLEQANLSPDMSNDRTAALEIFRDIFPPNHQQFYKDLKNLYQVGPLLFVHAGLRMDVPLKDQNEEDLFWIRDIFLKWQGAPKDYLIVHGHTITSDFRPEILPHRIGVDTGSYRTRGCITAAVFEKDQVRFISSGPRSNFQPGPFS